MRLARTLLYKGGRDSEKMKKNAAKRITAKLCLALAMALLTASVIIFGYSYQNLQDRKSVITEFSGIDQALTSAAFKVSLLGKPESKKEEVPLKEKEVVDPVIVQEEYDEEPRMENSIIEVAEDSTI